MPQQVPVVLDHHAAAARGDDDRLGAALDVRPPGVDVALDDRERPRLARSGDSGSAPQQPPPATRDERDADAVEHARHRGVDDRRERALHAAVEHEHLPPMPRGGPRARRGARRESSRASSRGSTGFSRRPAASAPPNSGARQQASRMQPAHGARARASAATRSSTTCRPMSTQPPVLRRPTGTSSRSCGT